MNVTQSKGYNNSWHKPPNLSYIERINNTSFLDKLQVITGDGKALPKSYYYEKYKELSNTYKNFYSIPEKLPDIKIVKKEEKKPKELPENQKINSDYIESKVVQFKPIINSIEPKYISGTMEDNKSKFKIYNNAFNYNNEDKEVRGKKLDMYI